MANCHNCERLVICPWANPEEIICSSFKAKPITNADRIRSMSDEKLAEFMKYSGASCPDAHFVGDYSCHDCKECWLDWLKQEASE